MSGFELMVKGQKQIDLPSEGRHEESTLFLDAHSGNATLVGRNQAGRDSQSDARRLAVAPTGQKLKDADAPATTDRKADQTKGQAERGPCAQEPDTKTAEQIIRGALKQLESREPDRLNARMAALLSSLADDAILWSKASMAGGAVTKHSLDTVRLVDMQSRTDEGTRRTGIRNFLSPEQLENFAFLRSEMVRRGIEKLTKDQVAEFSTEKLITQVPRAGRSGGNCTDTFAPATGGNSEQLNSLAAYLAAALSKLAAAAGDQSPRR